jgi:hypothetical protein
MNFEQARFNMIEQQLRPGKVLDPDVLDLFMVKREEFVPPRTAGWPLPTRRSRSATAGARMFAPIVEALALQALAMKKHENVLEIGTGSGYMAALLGAHATMCGRSRSIRNWRTRRATTCVAPARQRGGGNRQRPCRACRPRALRCHHGFRRRGGGSSGIAGPAEARRAPVRQSTGAAPAMEAVISMCGTDKDFRRRALFETAVAPLRPPCPRRLSYSERMRQLSASQLNEWLADPQRAKPVLLDVREPGSSPPAASPVRNRCQCAASRRATRTQAATPTS